tara:strand:+ start:2243 stop:3145 length:903 start_codon:yes stop_codon:yes gene_type:complete
LKKIHSNGKLLITGEYLVLDGAISLALPCNYGQSLSFKSHNKDILNWISLDVNKEIWFEASFEASSFKVQKTSDNNIVKWVQKILKASSELSKSKKKLKGTIINELEFPSNWGLGSSSTLLNNISNLYEIDPYDLHFSTTNGSGYDIACASSNSSLTYQIINNKPIVNPMDWNPNYKNEIIFIYLNKKQKSNLEIKRYNKLKKNPDLVNEISNITKKIIRSKNITEFEKFIDQHELIISELMQTKTVKEKYFSDYNGSIKSLGAWGGDFILATKNNKNYFLEKGFNTVFSFSELIKNKNY